MHYKSFTPIFAAAALALALPATSFASGYSFSTQSAAAQSTSNASMAEAADASTLYNNPAGMAFLEGKNNLSANLIYVAPNVKYYDAQANYTSYAAAPPAFNAGAIAGSTSGQIADSAIAPHVYYTRKINPKITAGIGLYVPYGTSGEYGNDSVLRYNGNKLSLKGLAISPTIAWKMNERHSFGFGVTAQHLEAELRQYANMVPVMQGALAQNTTLSAQQKAQLGALVANNGDADAYADIKGDDWALGFHMGWLGQITPTSRLGVTYRSSINHTLKGTTKWKYTNSPAFSTPLAAAPRGAGYAESEDTEVDITTPASLSIHGMHQANDKWTVFGDITWTGHSEFDQVNIEFANPKAVANATNPSARIDSSDKAVLVPNWDDTYKVAVGAAYKYSPKTQIRFGAAFDKSPIPSADYRLTTSPGNDRIWLSAGIGTEIAPNTTLNLAYSYVDIKNAKANVNGFCGGTKAPGATAANCVSSRTEGSAKFKSHAHILGLQLNYKF